jgi:uncharacterized membrane protein
MKTSRKRARALTARSNVALTAAIAVTVFAVVMLVGSGLRITAWTVRLTALILFAAAVSLACRWLAHLSAGKGDSPPVTHPSPIMSQAPSEVGK